MSAMYFISETSIDNDIPNITRRIVLSIYDIGDQAGKKGEYLVTSEAILQLKQIYDHLLDNSIQHNANGWDKLDLGKNIELKNEILKMISTLDNNYINS
ncbi:hypothetical protein HNV12_08850 [Methanococcoides sp. SA1]|nr:hypothetical protein [Methanococcoides sp. SA1]